SFRSIVLQKISKDGELFWTNPLIEEDNTNGLVLDSGRSPESVGYYTLQLAGEGKIATFHQRNHSLINLVENIATLFDVSGEQPEYINEGFIFSEQGASKAGLLSSPLFDNKYFLTFWSDFRSSSINDGAAVFAHKVLLKDLTVTGIRFPETDLNSRFGIFSNKASGTVDFILDSSTAGKATLEIYSVTGQKATRIQSKVQAGENIIPWNVQHVPAGVYIAQLVTQNGVQAKRFIVK
ncbi:MAG: T9SS type A sorting domain-containing protein, partial [Dysgonamonadaceae bacterium]|nr:T9SS type A sorting domain-containing protein [Dysgonamonadaceae bacterium]